MQCLFQAEEKLEPRFFLWTYRIHNYMCLLSTKIRLDQSKMVYENKIHRQSFGDSGGGRKNRKYIKEQLLLSFYVLIIIFVYIFS